MLNSKIAILAKKSILGHTKRGVVARILSVTGVILDLNRITKKHALFMNEFSLNFTQGSMILKKIIIYQQVKNKSRAILLKIHCISMNSITQFLAIILQELWQMMRKFPLKKVVSNTINIFNRHFFTLQSLSL